MDNLLNSYKKMIHIWEKNVSENYHNLGQLPPLQYRGRQEVKKVILLQGKYWENWNRKILHNATEMMNFWE